ASVVLPTPGTSSMRRWPRARSAVSAKRMASSLPRMTVATASSTRRSAPRAPWLSAATAGRAGTVSGAIRTSISPDLADEQSAEDGGSAAGEGGGAPRQIGASEEGRAPGEAGEGARPVPGVDEEPARQARDDAVEDEASRHADERHVADGGVAGD